MKKNIYSLFIAVGVLLSNGNLSAQISSAASGEWSDGTTWTGGVAPTSSDDVVIGAGHTISVSNTLATCQSVSFGGNDAHIDMNENARLTVYGNFTLFSTAHNVFSAGWSGTDAKIIFAGDQEQVLSGWNPDGKSTSLRDVIVDKTGGKLSTDGSGMRLCIQNSLLVKNGVLFLNDNDDIEGRWVSSGNYTNANLPDITVEAGGQIDMGNSGWHHIRSGTGNAIGKVTVHGIVRVTRASSNGIHFNGIDVEDGGDLQISGSLYSSSSGIKFHPGAVIVKSGGLVSVSTTSDVWDANSSVEVQAGGVFSSSASSTVFPGNFTDNGMVSYNRQSDAVQNIADRDYNHLKIEINNLEKKSWHLSQGRTVGSLTIVNEGQLVLSADQSTKLTVSEAITITSGKIIVPIASNVSLDLAATSTITEDENNNLQGVLSTERTSSQGVNEAFGNVGFELNAGGAGAGVVSVYRVTGEPLTIGAVTSINRYFNVVASNNTSLDANLVLHYLDSELAGIDESTLSLYYSTDLTNWEELTGTLDAGLNTITVSGAGSITGTYTFAKAGLATNIEAASTSLFDVKCYPNPASVITNFEIESDNSRLVNLKIYNSSGTLVKQQVISDLNAGKNTLPIDVSGWSKGMYFCTFKSGNETVTKKLVVN